ncbi:nuclear receptor-interacting protein 2 isoform X4 [Manacus vitellinus]|uniref:nuclear receptor-interacting protein 2 isoform X4 n=1 Tax=Manacus vitellinus TaxID=328815 RepID=UPI000847A28F|nr:nuclear receptor-interacting protein 2 isoform X4 [Manacus vitellinus]
MSTKKSCHLPLGQGDEEEKQSEGTPELERQECEMELRNKAILQQKRRLKQATQFVHKDSADLLPLDGLTRLGTSKDLCQGQVLKATVNTGCLPNLISKSCLNQLGLEEVSAMDCGDLSLPIPSVVGRVEHMELQFGPETVLCSALVVDDEMLEFCIGLQTLWSLKLLELHSVTSAASSEILLFTLSAAVNYSTKSSALSSPFFQLETR